MGTLISKLAAGTVAAVLTAGGSWAFAEVAEVTPVDEPVTDPVPEPTTEPVTDPVADVVTDPVEDVVTDPVAEDDDAEEADDDAEEADDDAEEADEAEDGEVKDNHGAYVSEVARTTPAGPGHGEAVREAARSDVGKKKATTETTAVAGTAGAKKAKGRK